MTSGETQPVRGQENGRYFKRLGFGVLGALGTLYGTEGLAAGVITAPIAPLFATASLGLGAAFTYGGYKAFQHAAELETGVESDDTKEARIAKLGRYAGGAALLFTGVAVANTAFLSSVGVLAGVGLWAGGVALGAWGIHKLRTSFTIEDARQPVVAEQGAGTYRDRASAAKADLQDIFHRYFGSSGSDTTPQPAAV